MPTISRRNAVPSQLEDKALQAALHEELRRATEDEQQAEEVEQEQSPMETPPPRRSVARIAFFELEYGEAASANFNSRRYSERVHIDFLEGTTLEEQAEVYNRQRKNLIKRVRTITNPEEK